MRSGVIFVAVWWAGGWWWVYEPDRSLVLLSVFTVGSLALVSFAYALTFGGAHVCASFVSKFLLVVLVSWLALLHLLFGIAWQVCLHINTENT